MNDSHEKKLDELLGRELFGDVVKLPAEPDFADWCRKHPDAVNAIRSQPKTIAERRARMKRFTRYTVSTAAVLLILVTGAYWMLFGNGAKNAWAEAIEKLSEIHSAVCRLRVYNGGHEQVSKIYLEGSRIRWEEAYQYRVTDMRQGKMLLADRSTKTAAIVKFDSNLGGTFVLGGNPVNDLVRLKDAPAERLPDERVDDTLCHVYRVTNVAFIGTTVPWIKVWFNPETRLPLRVHSVVDDSLAMTLDDFQWNEPFDKGLLTLDVPEGYTLEESKSEAKPGSAAPSKETESIEDDGNTESGRAVPADEIAETLNMLGDRIEANYREIRSWSGTFDVKEFSRSGPSAQYETTTHAEVRFVAEPGKDLLRLDYKAVEPIKMVGGDPVDPLPESRWLRTSKELYRFPVSEPHPRIEGFPKIMDLDPSKASRVFFREPPGAASQYTHSGFMNPLTFFGIGSTPYWEMCRHMAKGLRGELDADASNYVKKSISLRVRTKEDGVEYVLTRRDRPFELGGVSEWVFSSKAGLNVVCLRGLQRERERGSRCYTFRKENGVFIPSNIEFTRYRDQGPGESSRKLVEHRVYVLKETRVNEPIDPAVFQIQSLGLRDGDRMVDRIENEMFVFDGKKLVPAREFKLQPAAEAKREDLRRAESINNLKQILIAMHGYHDAHKRFPPRAVFDKSGKPLLSWRVLLLPYLDEEGLYKQFRLDEPWDGPHNKKLIAKMPQCFRSPASEAPPNTTTYLVPAGKGTLFEGTKGLSVRDVRDGTSNTVMLVEAGDAEAVPWTKPDDFEVDPSDPKKGLVGSWPDGFLLGLADGSAQFVPASVDPAVLKAVFTYRGGEKSAMKIHQY